MWLRRQCWAAGWLLLLRLGLGLGRWWALTYISNKFCVESYIISTIVGKYWFEYCNRPTGKDPLSREGLMMQEFPKWFVFDRPLLPGIILWVQILWLWVWWLLRWVRRGLRVWRGRGQLTGRRVKRLHAGPQQSPGVPRLQQTAPAQLVWRQLQLRLLPMSTWVWHRRPPVGASDTCLP